MRLPAFAALRKPNCSATAGSAPTAITAPSLWSPSRTLAKRRTDDWRDTRLNFDTDVSTICRREVVFVIRLDVFDVGGFGEHVIEEVDVAG